MLALETIVLLPPQFSEPCFARTMWVLLPLRFVASLARLAGTSLICGCHFHPMILCLLGETLSPVEGVSFLSWRFALQSSFSGGAFLRAYTGVHTKRWLKTCLFLLLVNFNRWFEKFFNWVISVLL